MPSWSAHPRRVTPEICLHFIERKVPVLCEKPFAVSVAETTRVLEAARKHRVTITMASKFRYVEDVVEAKRIVDSGAIGDIVLFENAFTARVDMSNRWNSNPAISGGGVLIDNGTHSVDLARYFLGPLAEVHVIEGPRTPDLQVEDTVSVFVRSKNGVMGTIDLSWSINKELDRYVSIFGTRGTVLVGWKESKYRQMQSADWMAFGSGYDKIGAFRAQINQLRARHPGAKRHRSSPRRTSSALRRSSRPPTSPCGGATGPRYNGDRHEPRSHGERSSLKMAPKFVHPTALIEDGVKIGDGTSIWDNVHIRHGSTIGDECIVGEKTYIAYDVTIGNRVKINAMVYICNGGHDRGRRHDQRRDHLHERPFPAGHHLRPQTAQAVGARRAHAADAGASKGPPSGAGCIIGNDLTIGRFAMVGMGSLVTKSVDDFHLVIGHPARPVGCVCRCGQLLLRFKETHRACDRGALPGVRPALSRLGSESRGARSSGMSHVWPVPAPAAPAAAAGRCDPGELLRRSALGGRRRRPPGHDPRPPPGPARPAGHPDREGRPPRRPRRPPGVWATWSGTGTTTSRCCPISYLRALLGELGLEQEIRWVETRTGFYTDGGCTRCQTPSSSFAFRRSGLIGKLRLAATIFYASTAQGLEAAGEDPGCDWLRRWSGKRTFEKIWLPLLRAKLGENYTKTSAAFIWATIARMYAARRTGLKQEMFGYVPGGYARILDVFRRTSDAEGVR